ncbi:MAG TPA: tetratricopeptide repeat protein [Dokdonella sp.]|uniref:tetratricopeptide repeat protein n=1 Tax=Dokdonella sp. TaxID=2291710 RepID=UPI002D7FFB9C|nr:tetratricopeptide repeat protein [Dokdonella sp.]HET9032056.1 tetratricopeptide repeat protein [Dokdonella sp.]
MPDSPAPPALKSIDITTANFEAELLQPSMTQPVLVIFWTPRSEASISLGSLLEKISSEYRGSLKLTRIDVDAEAQVAAMFGVRSIPTVILMREGQPADGFAGELPEAEIRELLGRHVPAPPAVEEEANAEKPAETPEQAIARLQQEIAASPEREELKLDLAVAFMQSGNAKAASAELDTLPANLETDDRAKRVRGQLEFAELLREAPSAAELEARIAKDPADLEARDLLGVRLLVDGQTEAGLEQFLAVLKADRNWNDGQAKKRLIAAFLGIDDAELVGTYRRRMSSLLF